MGNIQNELKIHPNKYDYPYIDPDLRPKIKV